MQVVIISSKNASISELENTGGELVSPSCKHPKAFCLTAIQFAVLSLTSFGLGLSLEYLSNIQLARSFGRLCASAFEVQKEFVIELVVMRPAATSLGRASVQLVSSYKHVRRFWIYLLAWAERRGDDHYL